MHNKSQVADTRHGGNREVTLTIIYEDKPSKTVVGMSDTSPTDAELNAFRLACDQRFLCNAKMLLIRDQQTTRAEFFQHSKAYHHFLSNS